MVSCRYIRNKIIYCISQSWRAADKRAATNDDMAKCIKAINKKLAPMAQEISVTKCGITNGNFVVFADTSEAAIMK